MAEVLLPPENFGRKASLAHQSNKERDSNNKSKGFGLRVLDYPKFNGNYISLDFEIICGKKANSFSLELIVKTESGAVAANKWESNDGIGKRFPINIKKC